MEIPPPGALEFLDWFREQTAGIARRRPGPGLEAWLASLGPDVHEKAADALLWWLSFQEWPPMARDVEEMVYLRLSFAWSRAIQALESGAPVPVTLAQRTGVIHGLVFREWVEHGLEFLEAYARTGPKDDAGNSLN